MPAPHLLLFFGEPIAVRSDSRVPRNGRLQTPSGPEGSSGSGFRRVPRGCLAVTRGGNAAGTLPDD